MSSPTSRFDRGGDGADRQFLATGETNNDSESINMITKTRCIDLGHKLHRLLHNPSSAPAMADMVARRRYAGETRPVELKQMA